LRPHLARAGYMAARLQLANARAASQTLASLGLAALVLDDAGKVLAANELIEAHTGLIHWRAQDRFSLADSCADALLHDALNAIGEPTAGVRSFPLRGAVGEAVRVAHVVPIRRAAQDIFSRCAAALVLTPVTALGAPPCAPKCGAFSRRPVAAVRRRWLRCSAAFRRRALAELDRVDESLSLKPRAGPPRPTQKVDGRPRSLDITQS
jgi:hypothetical protein